MPDAGVAFNEICGRLVLSFGFDLIVRSSTAPSSEQARGRQDQNALTAALVPDRNARVRESKRL